MKKKISSIVKGVKKWFSHEGIDPINAQDQNGQTQLYLEAASGNTASIEALLLAGADPNIAVPSGDGPLHALISSKGDGAFGAVLLLLEYDANPLMPNSFQKTPSDYVNEYMGKPGETLLLMIDDFINLKGDLYEEQLAGAKIEFIEGVDYMDL